MKKENLRKWGLTDKVLEAYDQHCKKDGLLGRIVEVQKGRDRVVTEEGLYWCHLSGRYQYETEDQSLYPTVGDWVQVTRPQSKESQLSINVLLPRWTKFSRKASGTKLSEQLIAANIDYIFICMALNGDYNLKRLDRYVSLAWQSGAKPIILLTKADLCETPDLKEMEVRALFIGLDVYSVCGFEGQDVGLVRGLISEGKTAVFTGSSGVGKSTLVNKLIGEDRQKTAGLRSDEQGRHTTTYRELIVLEAGGVLVDTPGMREFGLIGDEEEGLSKSFADIEALSQGCKFNNCQHGKEVGCRIRQALEEGDLSSDRYESYLKLQKETAYMERKASKAGQKSYMRAIGKKSKSRTKVKY